MHNFACKCVCELASVHKQHVCRYMSSVWKTSASYATACLLSINCAGIASVLAAIFIVASEQGNMSVRSGASLAVVVISGMLMIGFGAIAHNASRRHQIGTSIAAMFMALSVEALGGFLLWWFDLPFRTTIYIGVAAAQLLPVVFAILAGVTIECVKSRIASRLAEVNTSKTVAVVLHPTPQETAAAIKVQGIVRGEWLSLLLSWPLCQACARAILSWLHACVCLYVVSAAFFALRNVV